MTDIETLLQPVPGDEPCGGAMRYDPVFTEIRLAREEDDPSLPMGQWERPLKRADWPLIEQRCKEFLSHKSKDLQIAAWLLESWTRQQGLGGLATGLALMRELLARWWDCVHPRIDEDGDSDARVAALQWLNESIPLTLKVHVPLITVAGRKRSRLSFADWDRMTAEELTGAVPQAQEGAMDDEAPLTRAEVIVSARNDRTGAYAKQLAATRECLANLAAVAAIVDGKLGVDSPNLKKLQGMLDTIERMLLQLQPAPAQPQPEAPAALPEPSMDEQQQAAADGVPQPVGSIPYIAPIVTANAAPAIRLDGIRSREEAYRALEVLAQYLGQIEPHSPTPYLIRRAVNWGRMPLPELMEEILREEGDLNRITQLLGLNRPQL